ARIGRLDDAHFAGDAVEAGGGAVFEAAAGGELHADADAEEWPAAGVDRFADGLDHAVDRVEIAPAVAESAVAGEDDAVGPRHHIGVTGYLDGLGESHAGNDMLERFRR